MSLAQELDAVKTMVKGAVPAPIFEAIGTSIGDLEASGLAEQAAGVGSHIALPELPVLNGGSLDLALYAAGRPLILVFFRGGWCPYCDVTLRAYAKALPDVVAAGAALAAVTPDLAFEAAKGEPLGFPVVVDRGNSFARRLGLVFALPPSLQPLYRDIGIDLPARNGDDSHELAIPATYLIDPASRVAWAHVDANFTKRAEPGDVLAALIVLHQRATGTSRAA